MVTSRQMRRAALALTLVAALPACSAFEACQSQACLTDQKISSEVEKQFDKRAEFLPNTVHVQTHDGVVYLYGFVDTQYEKAIATSVAKVQGVKDVRNELRGWPM